MLETGDTPLVGLSNLVNGLNARLFLKLEGHNSSGSVKDRAVAYILEKAKTEGRLNRNSIITELTPGTTGVSAAWAAHELGYACEIVSSPDILLEKKEKIESYGGKIIFLPTEVLQQGVPAVFKFYDEFRQKGNYFPLNQFSNPLFAEAYESSMIPEIQTQLYGQPISTLIASVGTGSTLMGVSSGLKKINQDLKIIAVEPAVAPGGPGPWENISGLRNTNVVHLGENDVYDLKRATKTTYVTLSQAESFLEKLADLGIEAGTSSGAVLYAVMEAEKLTGNVVMLSCDGYKKGE